MNLETKVNTIKKESKNLDVFKRKNLKKLWDDISSKNNKMNKKEEEKKRKKKKK